MCILCMCVCVFIRPRLFVRPTSVGQNVLYGIFAAVVVFLSTCTCDHASFYVLVLLPDDEESRNLFIVDDTVLYFYRNYTMYVILFHVLFLLHAG